MSLVAVRVAVAVLVLSALSGSAGADLWTQTDWSGGDGQLSWSDTTMYYTGSNVDGWRSPGDLRLSVPNDAVWVNTGDLTGAQYAYDIIELSDGNFYAATGPGGDVFKSTDAGTTWVNTGELVGPTYAHALLEASDGAIYAGTGPTDGDVFKTTDAGSTWVNTGDLAGAAYVWTLIEASDGAIYAGSYTGGNVFKSVNAGTSWANTGNLSGATDVNSLLEASDGSVYAGTWWNGDVFKAAHFSSGYLVSSVLEAANASVTYGIMSWTETLNGQLVQMKARTDTLPDMSTALDWDTCPPVVNGEDISSLYSVDDYSMYIQYQLECSTDRADVTPVLHDVLIEYTVDVDGPVLDSAVASDGTNLLPGIDDDDYVLVSFDQPANQPPIDALNIDSVLSLSGGHSWLDGFGALDTTYWNPAGDRLMIRLSVDVSPPTVAVGDTVTPDGITILDEWGNPCTTQVIITGSFESPGVEEGLRVLPAKVSVLFQNRPNPFVSSTALRYSFAASSRGEQTRVRLSVFDLAGRLVETLVDKPQAPGTYTVSWNAGDNSDGIYFYRLKAGSFSATRKMVLAR